MLSVEIKRLSKTKMLRAIFRVENKQVVGEGVELSLRADFSGSPENEAFFALTPVGDVSLVVKPEVSEQFEVGREYYLDFSPAPVVEKPEQPTLPVEDEPVVE